MNSFCVIIMVGNGTDGTFLCVGLYFISQVGVKQLECRIVSTTFTVQECCSIVRTSVMCRGVLYVFIRDVQMNFRPFVNLFNSSW